MAASPIECQVARDTTLASWVKAVRRCLDASGCDSDRLLERAGLNPRLLNGPYTRCSRVNTSELWRLAVEATGDPGFGLRVASHITHTTFHALSYSLSASTTLKEAFERVVRYTQVVSDAVEYRFERQGEEYRLTLEGQQTSIPLPFEVVDALVAAHLRMCRSLLDHDYSPLRIELRRPQPQDTSSYQRILRAPILFGAAQNRIVFDRGSIERTLESGNADLAQHNDAILHQLLVRIDRENVQARVRAVLVERLQHGEPSQEEVAGFLNMSSRTLQRKLGDRGTSYMEILDATRRELALAYLSRPRHSVGEVTYLVGFSASSSFTRAFRRWTGLSPSDWRARALEQSVQVASNA